MTALRTYGRERVTLREALESHAGDSLIGICLSPARFQFARWTGTALEAHGELDEAQVYEARFFNHLAELRWLRDPGTALGSAAWLSEDELRLPGWQCHTLEVRPLPDHPRLMDAAPGGGIDGMPAWRWMGMPRRGKVAMPIDPGLRIDRAAYLVREYLGLAAGSAGEDGNLLVVEERILGLLAPQHGSQGVA